MLYGIKNEQDNCHDVRDAISEQMNIIHMFFYKSLACWALTFEIIVYADT